ncbi:hypothetical protein [Pseudophaeobacter arcticus]|uniref:hypothetical protein n=2 Tax=Pseudophaeobacter arcticus TaxID=385492 RepID=UPI003A986E96
MSWGHFSGWGGGRSAWGGHSACQSKSYHDGGVRDGGFDRWYSDKLSNHFGGRGGHKHWQRDEDDHGSGTAGSGTTGSDAGGSGTAGSGTGGSHGGRDHGGKKNWWNNRDDENNGTGGSGTGGTGDCGSGGGGRGDHGGHGRWGKKWWQDRDHDEDGSGTGGSGTGGSGTGGSGTGGSGTGGSGTGCAGTGGTGTGGTGTGGTGDTGGGDGGSDGKTTISFEIGGNGDPSVTVEVTQTPQGQLFINLHPTSYDGEVADIDGMFFNMSDDETVNDLNFHPSVNGLPVTGQAAEANAVNALDTGTTVPETFDGMVQFGRVNDSTDGEVNSANFTLWSDNGLTLDDIDLSSVSLVVSNPDGSQNVLSGGYDPAAAASDSSSYANGGVSDEGLDAWYAANTAPTGNDAAGEDDDAPGSEEFMALMNQPVEDLPEDCQEDEELESDCLV